MKCCDIYLNQEPNTYWMDQCQFILCKVHLFLYCDVFLLLRFPFYFISFRFPPSFVQNKAETTCYPRSFFEVK